MTWCAIGTCVRGGREKRSGGRIEFGRHVILAKQAEWHVDDVRSCGEQGMESRIVSAH